ncbi:MAG: 1,2-phenylacetyl-CoA epoxidase subunit PaaC [Bacillota bacterium]
MTARIETPAQALADPACRRALVELLYQLADDDLALGHRDSEWMGLAPHIEEDVAFASIAQDEVGHANAYYALLVDLGEAESADALAYGRSPGEWRCAVLLERPNGPGHYLKDPQFDWGYTIARHYLYDLFEMVRLEALMESAYLPLAQLAAKVRREERYHLLHMETWVKRLARHSSVSRARLQAGLEKAWVDLYGLFSLGPEGPAMAALGLLPGGRDRLWQTWRERAQALFAEAGLPWPGDPSPVMLDGRAGQHSADLEALLATMTEVYRLDPAARW